MFLLDNSGLGLFDAFFLIRKERNIKLEGGVDDWHRIGEGRDQIEQRRRGIYAHILHTHTHTHIHTLDVKYDLAPRGIFYFFMKNIFIDI